MSSKDVRPLSAKSKFAWSDYGGQSRPDSQFDFKGPRDDADLKSSVDEIYSGKEKEITELPSKKSKKKKSCWQCFTKGIRCKCLVLIVKDGILVQLQCNETFIESYRFREIS